MDLHRRQFLRGDIAARQLPLFPPWSVARASFAETCTRCGDCLRVCRENILVKGDGGFPVVDFNRGECTFCGECEQVCKPHALDRSVRSQAWQVNTVLSKSCLALNNITCMSCVDHCEARAIHFKPRVRASAVPEIDVVSCTGCGACIAQCPVKAISIVPNDFHRSKTNQHQEFSHEY